MQQYAVPSGTVCNHMSMEPRRAYYIHENDLFMEKYIAAFEAHRDRGTACTTSRWRRDSISRIPPRATHR